MSALPRRSPWGEVQRCEKLIDGVFLVNSSDLGGIMVRQSAAGFLSADALKCGFKANSSYCFESDYNEPVVIREMLDKKLWELPSRITDKAGYEDSIDRALQLWQPEYWEARRKNLAALPARVDPEMPDVRKDIIFRDTDYKEKFRIKDGDSIKITVAYDGEVLIRKCRWIDEAHMNVGSTPFHMDEFMEKQTRVGNKYEPLPGQEPKLNVVIAETGKLTRHIEIPMTYAAMRELLGGKPEIVSTDKSSAVVTARNGNGSVIVCGLHGGDLTNLHPYVAQRHTVFSDRAAATDEKTKLADRLEAGRTKAAEHNAAAIMAPAKRRHTEVGD